jgi:hypothetical protein
MIIGGFGVSITTRWLPSGSTHEVRGERGTGYTLRTVHVAPTFCCISGIETLVEWIE